MSRKPLIRMVIVLTWLGMVFWLVRYEAFPSYFTQQLDGYADVLSGDVLISETWMRILRDGKPVGYTRTLVDMNDEDPIRHIEYEHRVHMRFEMLGEPQLVTVLATAWLDVTRKLQAFDIAMQNELLPVSVTGERNVREQFDLVIETGDHRRTLTVAIPDDVIVQAPLTALAVRRLAPGRKLTVQTFNPLTLSRESVTLRGKTRETITLDGITHKALRIGITHSGAEFDAWVDAEGQLLRQETPFGWSLERTSPEHIFESDPTATNTTNRLPS